MIGKGYKPTNGQDSSRYRYAERLVEKREEQVSLDVSHGTRL
jgi:hypothetical protein